MSFTWTTFQQALAIEMAVPNGSPADPQFAAIVNTLVDQGEQRCYRDLDLLNATIAQTIALTPRKSTLDFSSLTPQILILEDAWLIVPAGVTDPDKGERQPIHVVSKEWVRTIYGLSATVGPPQYCALRDDHTLVFGPFPDKAYTAELVGKFRPAPLYGAAPGDGTQTTYLASVLPDLFLAATMIAATGYQHNFGAQSDSPQSAMSWEQQYGGLLQSAINEEQRKKFQGWMALSSVKPPLPMVPPTQGPAG
jgi:hypothetical protein